MLPRLPLFKPCPVENRDDPKQFTGTEKRPMERLRYAAVHDVVIIPNESREDQ